MPSTQILPSNSNRQKATFGAGYFWGVEAAFRKVPGVVDTAVGYMGGTLHEPTYRDVCTNMTGHAEVVALIFDPSQISYGKLLDVFWSIHDPTTPNRQGVDIGTQYRSVIFYHSKEQKKSAEESKERISKSDRFKHPIVTEIIPAQTFWRAEEYHQRYHEKHGGSGCAIY
ncbi:MAG: peptide-methionine (S)-S-oxide reductase MsrA [Methanoregulaceae archaeon]|jgi:peptide-methionine (S)-S-oxide reductase